MTKTKKKKYQYVVTSDYDHVLKPSYTTAEKTAVTWAQRGDRNVLISKVVARASAVVEVIK